MSTSSSAATEVDAAVWRAVAGASFQIPPLNSYVYYFPQGHVEQHSSAATAVENHNIKLKRPFIPCQVLSVRLLSHPFSDQVFVKFLLQPLHSWEKRLNCTIACDGDENDVVSFAKVLTPSDANNGGGFSVPRFCADSIFPALDFASDPPVQNLIMKDTRNNAWEFRHIYRGTPRRHLLTTGWSKFVNAKRLIAGDSVVFMRKTSTNELFTGIRRAGRFGSNSCWDGGDSSGDSSNDVVLEAIKNSDEGVAFEVVHYPRFGSPDFVVSAEKVEDALRICWSVGMRVKMAVETEDSSRMTWFQGTVAATALPGSGPWCGSPWRMLQVTWDEPESLMNMKRVNPWQVEYIPPTSHLHSAFPPPKKFKALQNSEMITDGEEEFCFPMTELARSMAGHMNSPILNYYSPFPTSMQGARREQFCVPSSSHSQSDNSFQTFTQLLTNHTEPELRTVSTVLNIGTPHSENISPCTQSSSVHLSGVDLVAMQENNSSTKVGANSFQLFGKIIHASDSAEGGPEHQL
ncbi:Auxin response factor 17 [Sesamum alatum]|uniref:Auxin response factor n=1 Tax=Sesamum alatum TaxID=300844 RepID=A0AAE1XKW5_9LAMI|nr:Auxin response factor 17 [Sesamum alatum]